MDIEKPLERPSWWTYPPLSLAILWTLLVFLAQIVSSVFVTIGWMLSGQDPTTSTSYSHALMLAGTGATAGIAVLVSVAVFQFRVLSIVAWRSCSAGQWLWVLLLVVPLQVVASEATNWAEIFVSKFEPEWLNQFRTAGREGILAINQLPWWAVFVVGCLLPGFGEELYWRGFLSRGLIRRYGVIFGTLSASFLFGAVHVFPVQAWGAFLIGIVMQSVFLTTRSLPAVVTLHTLNNALAFSLVRYEEAAIPGVTESVPDQVLHTPWPLFLSGMVLSGCLLAALYRGRTRWRLPDGAYWSPGYVTAERPPASLQARAETGRISWILRLAIVLALAAFAFATWRAVSLDPNPALEEASPQYVQSV